MVPKGTKRPGLDLLYYKKFMTYELRKFLSARRKRRSILPEVVTTATNATKPARSLEDPYRSAGFQEALKEDSIQLAFCTTRTRTDKVAVVTNQINTTYNV
jgi:hypothetical protein